MILLTISYQLFIDNDLYTTAFTQKIISSVSYFSQR